MEVSISKVKGIFAKGLCENVYIKKIVDFLGKIYDSNYFFAVAVAIAVSGFTFRFEIIAMSILLILASIGFLLIKNLTPTFLCIFLTCMVPLRFYGATAEMFLPLIIFLGIAVISMLSRMLIFPIKYRPNKLFYSQLIYSVALILGGLGYLTFKQYISLVPIYTILGLGVFQLFFLVYFSSYYKIADDKVVSDFSRMMVAIGINCLLFFLCEYLVNIPTFITDGFYLPCLQWKNNVGNVLLLAMPFCFYFIIKNKKPIINSIIVSLLLIVLFISRSRGATIFGLIVFIIGAIYTFAKVDKTTKKKFGIVLGVLLAIAIILVIIYWENILPAIQKSLADKSSGRFDIYKLGFNLFKESPIFGIGFYYLKIYDISSLGGNMTVCLFHSTFFQLIASLGLFGLISYSTVAFFKWQQALQNHTFNRVALFSLLGFALYSMINTGTVIPLPCMTIVTMITVICYKHNIYENNKNVNYFEISK